MRPPTRKIETETLSFHKFKPIKFRPIKMVERGVLFADCQIAPRLACFRSLRRCSSATTAPVFRDAHSAAASFARHYGFSGTVSGLPASATATTSTLAGSVSLALRDTA
jgi:hypothetical protein